jgi:hypothetical protein
MIALMEYFSRTDVPRKRAKKMTPKKLHEVTRVARFFELHFSPADVVVVDIGSGKVANYWLGNNVV